MNLRRDSIRPRTSSDISFPFQLETLRELSDRKRRERYDDYSLNRNDRGVRNNRGVSSTNEDRNRHRESGDLASARNENRENSSKRKETGLDLPPFQFSFNSISSLAFSKEMKLRIDLQNKVPKLFSRNKKVRFSTQEKRTEPPKKTDAETHRKPEERPSILHKAANPLLSIDPRGLEQMKTSEDNIFFKNLMSPEKRPPINSLLNIDPPSLQHMKTSEANVPFLNLISPDKETHINPLLSVDAPSLKKANNSERNAPLPNLLSSEKKKKFELEPEFIPMGVLISQGKNFHPTLEESEAMGSYLQQSKAIEKSIYDDQDEQSEEVSIVFRPKWFENYMKELEEGADLVDVSERIVLSEHNSVEEKKSDLLSPQETVERPLPNFKSSAHLEEIEPRVEKEEEISGNHFSNPIGPINEIDESNLSLDKKPKDFQISSLPENSSAKNGSSLEEENNFYLTEEKESFEERKEKIPQVADEVKIEFFNSFGANELPTPKFPSLKYLGSEIFAPERKEEIKIDLFYDKQVEQRNLVVDLKPIVVFPEPSKNEENPEKDLPIENQRQSIEDRSRSQVSLTDNDFEFEFSSDEKLVTQKDGTKNEELDRENIQLELKSQTGSQVSLIDFEFEFSSDSDIVDQNVADKNEEPRNQTQKKENEAQENINKMSQLKSQTPVVKKEPKRCMISEIFGVVFEEKPTLQIPSRWLDEPRPYIISASSYEAENQSPREDPVFEFQSHTVTFERMFEGDESIFRTKRKISLSARFDLKMFQKEIAMELYPSVEDLSVMFPTSDFNENSFVEESFSDHKGEFDLFMNHMNEESPHDFREDITEEVNRWKAGLLTNRSEGIFEVGFFSGLSEPRVTRIVRNRQNILLMGQEDQAQIPTLPNTARGFYGDEFNDEREAIQNPFLAPPKRRVTIGEAPKVDLVSESNMFEKTDEKEAFIGNFFTDMNNSFRRELNLPQTDRDLQETLRLSVEARYHQVQSLTQPAFSSLMNVFLPNLTDKREITKNVPMKSSKRGEKVPEVLARSLKVINNRADRVHSIFLSHSDLRTC